jgi:hypothetical protein
MRPPGPIERTGPADVVRRLLALNANDRPALSSPLVTPTAEVRASRPEEFFDEGILRWIYHENRAAQAGASSGHIIQGFRLAVAPKGSLIVIEEVANYSASNVFVTVQLDTTVNAVLQAAKALDRRWMAAAVDPGVTAFTGERAAAGGAGEIGLVPPNQVRRFNYVMTPNETQNPVDTFGVFNVTFAQVCEVTITGYIIWGR